MHLGADQTITLDKTRAVGTFIGTVLDTAGYGNRPDVVVDDTEDTIPTWVWGVGALAVAGTLFLLLKK